MKDAVSALREAFGSSPETSNLKELIAFTRAWVEESEKHRQLNYTLAARLW